MDWDIKWPSKIKTEPITKTKGILHIMKQMQREWDFENFIKNLMEMLPKGAQPVIEITSDGHYFCKMYYL